MAECGTARVFSQTLAHENSNNEHDIEAEEGERKRVNIERTQRAGKKEFPTA